MSCRPVETPCLFRGAESGIAMQVAVAQVGPVQIELVQQFCDRPNIYRDVLGTSSSGFHQICTVTAEYDAKRAHDERLGYELASEIERRGQRVAHFDTWADFGFYTEVTEDVPGFRDQLATIARTCAEWDGTDPVRLLTRDGYRTPESRHGAYIERLGSRLSAAAFAMESCEKVATSWPPDVKTWPVPWTRPPPAWVASCTTSIQSVTSMSSRKCTVWAMTPVDTERWAWSIRTTSAWSRMARAIASPQVPHASTP